MRWQEVKEARAWTNDPGRCTMVTVNALCDHFGKERPDQTRAPMHGVGVLELIRAAGLKYGMLSIYEPERQTVRKWVAAHPKGAFYISTAGHAMAVIEGKLFDATGRGLDGRIVQTTLEVYETERVAAPEPMVFHIRTDEDAQATDIQRKLKTRWNQNILIASIAGTDVAWFRVEKNPEAGTACVHSSVDASVRRMGISSLIYDIIEMQLEQEGLRLVPYHLLSDDAYGFWQKRRPEALAQHHRSGAKWSSLNESADDWITVYHGHQDAVSAEHEWKFFTTDERFADEYGSVTEYQIRLGHCLDTTDRRTVEKYILPIEHPLSDPAGGCDLNFKTWKQYSEWTGETWEMVEDELEEILQRYPQHVDSVKITEQGCVNYMVRDPRNMRAVRRPGTNLKEGASEDLFHRYGGKVMKYSQLPTSAQKAICAWATEGEPYEDVDDEFGYVLIPIEVLRDVCWDAPDNEMRNDYEDWNTYHDSYWSIENDADYANHLAEMWPVILDDGEGIVDGWHRLHWYYRNGVKMVPAIVYL